MDPHCFFRREQELYASNYSGLKDRFDPQSCVCVRFLHHRVGIFAEKEGEDVANGC